MHDIKRSISELADLMDEFALAEATLEGEGWKVAFSRIVPATSADGDPPVYAQAPIVAAKVEHVPSAPVGTPVSSPMNGVFYTSPNPGAPAFVREGDHVTVGQVVGLIEAMKVFNEITAPVGGEVVAVLAENGQLVQPDEPLIYIK